MALKQIFSTIIRNHDYVCKDFQDNEMHEHPYSDIRNQIMSDKFESEPNRLIEDMFEDIISRQEVSFFLSLSGYYNSSLSKYPYKSWV